MVSQGHNKLKFDICYSFKRMYHSFLLHYDDVIMGAMMSRITSLTIVYSTVYSGADQRKHQSSASLAFVWGIDRGPVNSSHKWPVMRKMFPFDAVIMCILTKAWKCNIKCTLSGSDGASDFKLPLAYK